MGIRSTAAATLLICLLSIPVVGVDAPPGQEIVLDTSGTAITVVTHSTSSSIDDTPWTITATLSSDAAANGSSLSWETQICIHSGICFAPEKADLNPSSDNLTWTGSITPGLEHNYIRYRIFIHWPDGNNESVPSKSYGGKVWSECWIDTNLETGKVTQGGTCWSEEVVETPMVSAALAIGVLAAASLAYRGRIRYD